VLAVGCRNTYELDYILAAGYGSVTGIDLRAEDPRIQRMDMQAMTFPDNCFDAVYSCHSLEHALDPRRAGLEFELVLRPRGVAIIEVPIHVKREKGDLWDFRDAETVASLLGGRLLWSETGQQVTAPQKVVRALVRVKDS
jgi:SAM-dependent methyltransferase